MISIIDYGIVNVGSVKNMLSRIGVESEIVSDKVNVEKASKIILPGIGHFDKAMQNLHQLDLVGILNRRALVDKVPILGICLGMQLLTKKSEEGLSEGFGWIDAETVKFDFSNEEKNLKLPHMGWNEIFVNQKESIIDIDSLEKRFYFVHKYHVKCNDFTNVMATTNYGVDFHSAICKNNIMGTQFHPEKSHKFGIELFKKFISL